MTKNASAAAGGDAPDVAAVRASFLELQATIVAALERIDGASFRRGEHHVADIHANDSCRCDCSRSGYESMAVSSFEVEDALALSK